MPSAASSSGANASSSSRFMRTRCMSSRMLCALATVLLLSGPAKVSATWTHCKGDGVIDWTYDARCSGSDGPVPPDMWHEKYPECAGSTQSPINLARDVTDSGCSEDIGSFHFSSGSCTYGELEYKPTNRNWEVGFSACADVPYFTLGDGSSKYKLLQYHLHTVSEHAMGGGYADAELHLVHINENDPMDAIVLGVMLDINADHYGNGELDKYWAHFASALKGDEDHIEDDDTIADPYALLPPSGDYYFYRGSLTTPPCSEIVGWVVMQEPVRISPAELKTFRDAIGHAIGPITDEYNNNNRPLQPLNGRRISQCSM